MKPYDWTKPKKRRPSRWDRAALVVSEYGDAVLLAMALLAGAAVLLAISWPDVWLIMRRWN